MNFPNPMVHGKHFFSMGVRILHFATPLEREGDFFHVFNTSPSNRQNEENRTSEPCCGGVSAEGVTSKIGSKSASCRGIYDRDTFFKLKQKNYKSIQ